MSPLRSSPPAGLFFALRACAIVALGALVLFAVPRHAEAAILSIAPRGPEFDERFFVWNEPNRWVTDHQHYMVQQMLLRFQGEAYRKAYANALALWEASVPPPPEPLRGYEHVTFWRKKPYKVRTAWSTSPHGGIPVRGLSGEAALAFVDDYKQLLGVPTAPRHVHVTRRRAISEHEYQWSFRQFPPGPEGIVCRWCRLDVVIDVRTMRITTIANTLIDLPDRGLPLPTTDGKEIVARFLELHPAAAESIPREPGLLTYAQDRYGDVSLVWEVLGSRFRQPPLGNREPYLTWFALDARNWSFRGFDVADDVYCKAGGEAPLPEGAPRLLDPMCTDGECPRIMCAHGAQNAARSSGAPW